VSPLKTVKFFYIYISNETLTEARSCMVVH